MTTSLTVLPDHTRVAVVGSGFAGLGTAIQLQRHGRTDFVVLEKASEVGGTWRDNTYPGAACDVPSQLYSFSFALNPEWSSSFSPQPEIQDYLRRTAAESGVLDRFAFDTEVLEATWDDEAARWRISTSRGEMTADVLVTGSGGLSEPKMPDIEGIDEFGGTIFHSARWDHDADLTGKRVAVIGTGASAIQIVPELAESVDHLDVYQRTAPWVMPRHDRRYTAVERFGFRHVPGLMRLYRTAIYWGREAYVPAFVWKPAIARPAQLMAKANIARGIDDPALREKVTPDFAFGCKRVLISNTYYPALGSDHVDVVDTGIARVTPTGIVDRDGVEREVDAIVVATGFHTTDQPIAHHVTGRDGRTLADVWSARGMAAYKGTTINGFPNLFQLVGPNTGLGHSSMVFVIESQIRYVLAALDAMDADGIAALSPTPAAQEAWTEEVRERMEPTVWNTGGCASWYLDEHGNNTTLWPRATFTFRRLLGDFDVAAYETVPVAAETRTAADAATTERETISA
ncbi:NAD(P)/FAD-dependent oxidoreductase [Nocardioidaceae bacterium]|nr:NAD(P)/FAD-dependent oxidoreductase [Nocardioidaceae bacterium]